MPTGLTNLRSPLQDVAVRTSDFILLPTNQAAPIVVSQPDKNVVQRTWISEVLNSTFRYQQVQPSQGIFRVLQGTDIEFSILASDPSNLLQPNDTSNLTFVWRRDGIPLPEWNNLNQYRGVRKLQFSAEECRAELSGQYVCEVINQHGSTLSDPLDVLIIDSSRYPKLYTNLIVNGNADAQLDGWQVDNDIISTRFSNNLHQDLNFGSLPGSDIWYNFEEGERSSSEVPLEFAFSQRDQGTTTHALIRPWIENTPDGEDWQQTSPWMNNSFGEPVDTSILPEFNQWILFKHPSQIIANEDGGKFNAFFPGMRWIDSYNRNLHEQVDIDTSAPGLFEESENQTLSYFTRDKLKFTAKGGKISSTMKQSVDVTDLRDFIDGNVIGVNHTSMQLFAYVGAGISRYQVKLTTTRGPQTLNWNLVDTEEFFSALSNSTPIDTSMKMVAMPGTTIEIIPLVEDVVEVDVNFMSEEELLDTHTILGPDDLDVYAIKDESTLPLALYPMFEFMVANGNPIKIYGQTYTTTDALQALFDPEPIFSEDPTDDGEFDQSAAIEVADRKANFMLQRYGLLRRRAMIPYNYKIKPARNQRGISEKGAAAMFAIELTNPIPRGTTNIDVVVRMKHTSEVILDENPRIKGWDKTTIYFENFTQKKGNSARACEYGYPRSGITKIKLIVAPNNLEVTNNTTTFSLPPLDNTVLGIRKARLSQDVHDSSTPGRFPLPYQPTPEQATASNNRSSPFLTLEQAEAIATEQRRQSIEDQQIQGDVGPDEPFVNYESEEAGHLEDDSQDLAG